MLLVLPLNPFWPWTSLFLCLSLNPVISNVKAELCESLAVPSDSDSDSDSVTGLFQSQVASPDPVLPRPALGMCPDLHAVRDSCLFYPDPNLNNLDSCSQLGGTLNGRK